MFWLPLRGILYRNVLFWQETTSVSIHVWIAIQHLHLNQPALIFQIKMASFSKCFPLYLPPWLVLLGDSFDCVLYFEKYIIIYLEQLSQIPPSLRTILSFAVSKLLSPGFSVHMLTFDSKWRPITSKTLGLPFQLFLGLYSKKRGSKQFWKTTFQLCNGHFICMQIVPSLM